MDEVLQLVRQLFINCRGEQATKKSVDHPLTKTVDNPLTKQNFLSKKITNKVVTQLQVTFIYIFFNLNCEDLRLQSCNWSERLTHHL